MAHSTLAVSNRNVPWAVKGLERGTMHLFHGIRTPQHVSME